MDYSQILNVGYWRSREPSFHICDDSYLKTHPPAAFSDDAKARFGDLIKVEGYFQGEGVDWQVDFTVLARAVRRLTAEGIPTVFAFVYDEFWVPFRKLGALYESLLGEAYFYLPDFWVWNVDPQLGQAGWGPHRDKGRLSLLPDGTPGSVTTWIALTDATPLNGCMYIVPADLDPTYNTPEESSYAYPHQSIRALPVARGDFLTWNQAVMHWGSKTSSRAAESRVSMAFEFQRGDIEPFRMPLLDPSEVLPFRARMALIAKQLLQYHHMYPLDPELERAALRVAGPLVNFA